MIDGVFQVLSFSERFQVAKIKRFANNRRDRENFAKIIGQALNAFFNRLLNRRRQGVGGDLCLLREAPGAGVVPGDPARLDERADELLREEWVSLGRCEQFCHQTVCEPGSADQGFQEQAML